MGHFPRQRGSIPPGPGAESRPTVETVPSPRERLCGTAVPLGRRDGQARGGTPRPRRARSLPQKEAPEPPPGGRGGGVTGSGAPPTASAALGRSGSRPVPPAEPGDSPEKCDNPIREGTPLPVGGCAPSRGLQTVRRPPPPAPRLAPTGVSAPGPSLENGA